MFSDNAQQHREFGIFDPFFSSPSSFDFFFFKSRQRRMKTSASRRFVRVLLPHASTSQMRKLPIFHYAQLPIWFLNSPDDDFIIELYERKVSDHNWYDEMNQTPVIKMMYTFDSMFRKFFIHLNLTCFLFSFRSPTVMLSKILNPPPRDKWSKSTWTRSRWLLQMQNLKGMKLFTNKSLLLRIHWTKSGTKKFKTQQQI